MTAKEYLSQARHLDESIRSQMRELAHWRRMADSISGIGYGDVLNGSNRTGEAPFVRCLEEIDEIERSIAEKIEQLIFLRDEISSRIGMLDRHAERLLLRYRYLDGMSWKDIQGMMDISESTVHRIHNSALTHFPVPDEKLAPFDRKK